MPIFTSHKPGTFSWMELGTTDTDAAKRFYGGLFGWKFEDVPAAPDMTYTFASVPMGNVGALYKMDKEMTAAGVRPRWAAYITVENVDATAKKVTANGGKLVKEPFDVMDVGRMAVAEDPAGASFCIWQAKKHHGAAVKMEPGSLCWNETLTTNVDAAGKFYANTFGWQTEAVDMGPMGTYTLFKLAGGDQQVAGMMPMPPSMKGPPSHWLSYMHVTDCDASAKKVTELGGKIVSPPADVPKIGRFAIAQDPAGATFAIFTNAS